MAKNGILKITAGITFAGLIINLVKQWVEIEDGTKEKFSWEEFFKWGAVSALVGVTGGLILDVVLPSEEDGGRDVFRETRYLRHVLNTHDPKSSIEHEFQKAKAKEIADAIQEEFCQLTYCPEVSGSHGKGTGLIGSSDYDLLIPFQKHAFTTTEEMYDATYEFLDQYACGDSEILQVRRQNKSIGLLCKSGEIETWIDVVPARERKDYLIDHELTLYVGSKDWFTPASYTKTNIHKHKELMKNSPSKRQVTCLFKIWKREHGVDISGFELELLVDRAFEQHAGQLPSTLYGKLFLTANFIHDNLGTIALRDPGARSKRLLDDPSRQDHVRMKIGRVLTDISNDPLTLTKWFPQNT